MIRRSKLFNAFMVAGLLGFAVSATAGEIRIVNKDAAGIGLNDLSPATPAGGNAGTTRGEQARIVFGFAANMWGAVLQSSVRTDVDASFKALQCDASGTVLGSTGTNGYIRFTANPPAGAQLNIWYPGALANALTGVDNSATQSEMTMSFNGALGTASCLPDSGWYFGLDGKTPAGMSNLLNVMLHEMGHGLGFAGRSTLTSGALSGGFNDIYSSYAYGNTANKYWGDMTNAQRKAAALDDGNLVFRGPNVTAQAPLALGQPPVVKVTAPAAAVGDYAYGEASFGPVATAQNFSGTAVLGVSGSDSQACTALTNPGVVAGHVAIVDRGTCSFQTKAYNAQQAGATAVLIANNAAGVIGMAADAAVGAVTVPTVMVSLADGAKIKANVPATVGLGLGSGLAGTDASGYVQLYAPTVLASGSSFSHYDTRLSPNALMEYAESADLKGHINLDLTPALFKDEGWKLNEGGQMLLTCNTGVPTWIPGGIVIGGNVYANARAYANASDNLGKYRTLMRNHAADLATQQLLSAPQATSLNACLSDAETQKQYRAWSSFAPATLQNGLTVAGQSGKAGTSKVYELDVPNGAIALTLRTLGGAGDVSIYVKVGEVADPANYTYKSVHAGTNAESILIARPVAGTYSVTVYGETDYSGVSVLGSFTNTPQ